MKPSAGHHGAAWMLEWLTWYCSSVTPGNSMMAMMATALLP
jgi:hypothetical protein